MKVLAKRENSMLIFFPLSLFIFIPGIVNIINWFIETDFFNAVRVADTDDFNYLMLSLLLNVLVLIIILSFTGCLLIRFIETLLTPPIVMEYDEYGIYIYNRLKETRVIRFYDIKSQVSEESDVDIYNYKYHIKLATVKVLTGTLRIELLDGFVRVDCVANVKDVERKLKDLVRKEEHKKIAELEARVEKIKRERELEELRKHNPDT